MVGRLVGLVVSPHVVLLGKTSQRVEMRSEDAAPSIVAVEFLCIFLAAAAVVPIVSPDA